MGVDSCQRYLNLIGDRKVGECGEEDNPPYPPGEAAGKAKCPDEHQHGDLLVDAKEAEHDGDGKQCLHCDVHPTPNQDLLAEGGLFVFPHIEAENRHRVPEKGDKKDFLKNCTCHEYPQQAFPCQQPTSYCS